MTADLVEDGLPASAARAFMAKLLAVVIAALEQSSTLTGTNVLSFKIVLGGARS